MPSNAAIPHIGATRVLSSSMVLWGIMSASTSLCTNATMLIVLRFGLGLAESGFYPGALTLTLTLTPNPNPNPNPNPGPDLHP